MKIINLTPHQVSVLVGEEMKTFEPSGMIARVSTNCKVVGYVDGIEIVAQTYGDIQGLPEPQEGTLYLVSLLVRQAAQAQGRTDVISPDTSPESAIRDVEGRIVGVRRFAR